MRRRPAALDRTEQMPGDAPQIINVARDGLIPYELDGPEYAELIEWRPCPLIVTERQPHPDAP
jgi:hypothetical protein